MKIQLWSKTTAGKWAASLILLFIVLISLKLLTLGISIKIPLPTPFIAGLGVIGFITGIVSTIFVQQYHMTKIGAYCHREMVFSQIFHLNKMLHPVRHLFRGTDSLTWFLRYG